MSQNISRSSSYLGGQERIEVQVEGQDRVVRDSPQELVQSFHPCLDELLRKAIYHALHHELLRERLQEEKSRRITQWK